MRQVILTVGPQGAGKTTFCHEIIKLRPEVVLVERDAILNELFGDSWTDPYSGAHYVGFKVMMERVEDHLRTDPLTLILDTWTGDEDERWRVTRRLRGFGADKIVAWYFVTDEDTVVRQFIKRSGSDYPENSVAKDIEAHYCRRNYQFYHSHPVELDQGFDEIELIDPHQLTLFPYADILL